MMNQVNLSGWLFLINFDSKEIIMIVTVARNDVQLFAQNIENLSLILNNELSKAPNLHIGNSVIQNINEFADDELANVGDLIMRLVRDSKDKLSHYETYVSFIPALSAYLTRLLTEYFLRELASANILMGPQADIMVQVTVEECKPSDKDVKHMYRYSGLGFDIRVKFFRTFVGHCTERVSATLKSLRLESFKLRSSEQRFLRDDVYDVIEAIRKEELTFKKVADDILNHKLVLDGTSSYKTYLEENKNG